jgi:replicative DNA helicase
LKNQMVVPPHSIEAEQFVLVAVLIDKEIIPQILAVLETDDFYREEHQAIFQAVLDAVADHNPVDILSVSEKLKKRDQLEFIGGIRYLANLSTSVPNTANAFYYAKKIREKAILRNAGKYAVQIEEKVADGDIEEIRSLAQNIISLQVPENDIPFSETFTEEDFRVLSKSKRWYSKHLRVISNKVPFMRGEDIIIAGKTSTGKTQLALNFAMDFVEQGAKVAYVSMEMGKIQMLIRLLNWEYGSEKRSLLTDIDLKQKEWQEMAKAMFSQKKYKNFFFYERSNDIAEIVSWIRNVRPDIVFLDYIQMIRSSDGKNFGRNYEIGVVARMIRQEISKERCVVVMSQMNRLKVDQPDLSQIRDSGEIEQTATSVLFIDRPDIDTDYWKFRVRVMKNQTFGAVSGWIDLFLKPDGEFVEEENQ